MDDIIKDERRASSQQTGPDCDVRASSSSGGVLKGGERGEKEQVKISRARIRDKFERPKQDNGLGPGPRKLVVSNLDPAVLKSDIEERFLEFVSLKKANVNYDVCGNPLGSGELIFGCSSDAIEAIRKYNRCIFFGRPMCIKLATHLHELHDLPVGSNKRRRSVDSRPVNRSSSNASGGPACRNAPDVDGGLNAPDVDGGLNAPDADGGLNAPDADGGLNAPDADGTSSSEDEMPARAKKKSRWSNV